MSFTTFCWRLSFFKELWNRLKRCCLKKILKWSTIAAVLCFCSSDDCCGLQGIQTTLRGGRREISKRLFALATERQTGADGHDLRDHKQQRSRDYQQQRWSCYRRSRCHHRVESCVAFILRRLVLWAPFREGRPAVHPACPFRAERWPTQRCVPNCRRPTKNKMNFSKKSSSAVVSGSWHQSFAPMLDNNASKTPMCAKVPFRCDPNVGTKRQLVPN